jgi:hypothetical protein
MNYAEKAIKLSHWDWPELELWKVIHAGPCDAEGVPLGYRSGPFSQEAIEWDMYQEAVLNDNVNFSYSKYLGYRCFLTREHAIKYAKHLRWRMGFLHGRNELFVVKVRAQEAIRIAESRDICIDYIKKDKIGAHGMPVKERVSHGVPVVLAKAVIFNRFDNKIRQCNLGAILNEERSDSEK